MNRWVLAVAMMFVFGGSCVQAKERSVVRFGIEGAYPPFSWTEPNGELRGFDVDLAYALCREMQVQCKIVAQPWNGIIASLLDHKYDAIIAAMSITDERKKIVDFTSKYALIPNRYVAEKDAKFVFTPEGLKGVKVGVLRASTHDRYLSDNFGDSMVVTRYGSFDEAFLDLKAERIAMVLGDAATLEDGLLNRPWGRDFAFTGPTLTDPKWFGEGFGIAVRKQDSELKNNLDRAIASLREKGIYQQIASRYFAYDVYGY
ncbi:nickel transporter [Photobacterium aquae]|uniref:Nickel transporter n=1 Tax=Photobacterium aquae TaxID=1195763 RepID=A0A0J1HC86_9GAMM|nr:transporter substrate-binding domain-containing protein [Photobacterium aquae]KLV09270.1 nickel transporter [Photobacterium aquae]